MNLGLVESAGEDRSLPEKKLARWIQRAYDADVE